MYLPLHTLKFFVAFDLALFLRVTSINFNLGLNLMCFLDILLPWSATSYLACPLTSFAHLSFLFIYLLPFYVLIPYFYNLLWNFCFRSSSLLYFPFSYFFPFLLYPLILLQPLHLIMYLLLFLPRLLLLPLLVILHLFRFPEDSLEFHHFLHILLILIVISLLL